jgi:hypothetical protein
MRTKLIVANCSGFYGDRLSAAEEMVRGGPIDVLTGDYLAELTMAILHRQRAKSPHRGYASTFLTQMERVLGECADKKIRVVSNAGGLNPGGLAEQIEALAERLGVHVKVAWIDGDDLVPRLGDLARAGERLAHLDDGVPLAEAHVHTAREHAPQGYGEVVTANAYLGSWGIREALARGADVVVCGRVTDAALVVGPAAWAFDWTRSDWDRLAGALVAGHVLECGPQATGGNYPFFEEVTRWRDIGFPIAELAPDGSFVVTKHPGTGGLVSIGTVTAQLLYEIQGARYLSPDVVARFDTLRLEEEGPDRVRVRDVRGEPPPATSKVAINRFLGYRNTMTVGLAGPGIVEKARRIEESLFASLGGRASFAVSDVHLTRSDRDDARSNDEALAYLRVTVADPDATHVGKAFSAKVVELALSSVPGFALMQPPGEATPYIGYWPALVDAKHIEERVHVGGEVVVVPSRGEAGVAPSFAAPPVVPTPSPEAAAQTSPVPTKRILFGRLFGARSGDKGGNASLGVWARSDDAYTWLRAMLTVDALKALLPDLAPFTIERCELPRLRAVHFVVVGLLQGGVASSTRIDPQGKTLAEYLRSKYVEAPTSLDGHALGAG